MTPVLKDKGMTLRQLRKLRCHDCGCQQGELHEFGCDREVCPQCGGQLMSCACESDPFAGKPRRPFICWPNICLRCGKLFPEMFSVPTEVWCHYVEPHYQDEMICLECWRWLVDTVDGGDFAMQFMPREPLVCSAAVGDVDAAESEREKGDIGGRGDES